MTNIEKEKNDLREKYNKEIDQKKIELEEQLAKLEKERKAFLVKNGNAIICKCGNFQENPEHNVCNNCWRNLQRNKRRADIEHKLKGSEITNIVFKYDNDIKEITVHKDGTSYMLEVHECDGDATLRIENEWCESSPLRTSRPGDMPRVEKSLLSFVKSRKLI